MHGRRRRGDVGEHRRIELLSFDEDLDRRSGALLERKREIGEPHRPPYDALGVSAQTTVRHMRGTQRSQRLPPAESTRGDDSCVMRRGRMTVETIRPYAIDIAVTNVSKPAVIPLTV